MSHLCSQQSPALELIKSKQRKDPRFTHLIQVTHASVLSQIIRGSRVCVLTRCAVCQECEASPHCRRLQLKDLLVAEMQRLTKYPLLLDNIIKYTESE